MIDYAWLIPILPYVAMPIALFFGKKTPEEGAYIAIAFTFVSFILATISFAQVIFGAKAVLFSYDWVKVGNVELPLTVLVDQLSTFMAFLVTLIGTLVLIFSLGYMHNEEGLPRYYAEMSLFVGSMLTIVMAGDFLTLFIGWELVGLSSYLLIGFWYKRPLAASAAKKAFLTTKFGDIFMVAAIALIYRTAGTLNIVKANEYFMQMVHLNLIDVNLLTLIGVFLFMGAMGKSAQGPLMPWLWDAMEGPTTVSAILHSSTMVKAGVFLIARVYPIIAESSSSMLFVAYVGGLTAFIAATMALVEFDIKRILAYSTISQIGYMMLALGVGAYGAGLFHLFSHATFKALLFLAAGSVVHAMHEVVHDPYLSRDLRYMGGLGKHMKITSITMLIGGLSLSGIPPFSGFFSKDLIIEASLETGDSLLFWLATITALLTAFYIFRLWYYAFAGDLRAPKLLKEQGHEVHEVKVHESPWVMTGPLVVLATLTTIIGFFGSPWFGGGFIKFVGGYLESNYHMHVEISGLVEHVSFIPLVTGYTFEVQGLLLSVAVLSFVGLGWVLAWSGPYKGVISTEWTVKNPFFGAIRKLLERRYLLDDFYVFMGYDFTYRGIARFMDAFDHYVVDLLVNAVGYAGLALAAASDFFDRYIVDGIVNGIGKLALSIGDKVRRLSIGIVQFYVMLIAIGMIMVILVSFFAPQVAALFQLG
ncbi:MAG: NADH-quinone oxidoreductase subunit L [Candidatus Njordarchaeia archaeon]